MGSPRACGLSWVLAIALLAAAPGRAEERCRPLDDEGLGGEVCLISPAADAPGPLRLEHRPGGRGPAPRLDLSLEPDLRLDGTGFVVVDLYREVLVWLPLKQLRAAGAGPAPEDACVSRLLRLARGARTWQALPARWVCRRPCTMQFVSYQTTLAPEGPRGTRLFHECTVDGQHLKSTYAWEGGALAPLEIEEPRDRDALSRGFAPPRFVPVCERSTPVQEALARELGKSCSALGPDDLARVTRLDLSGGKVARLAPGDFSGLGELTSLDLMDNPLAELLPGVFDGLWKLRSLNFQGCRLRRLPAGLFVQLGSLRDLYLNHNQLEEIAEDAFAGLSSLTFLALNDNRLRALPGGLLAPLAKDCRVYTSGNLLSP